jgi:serine/threonine-protein phosphatase 6 regulatory ankyrin repeat subunit A
MDQHSEVTSPQTLLLVAFNLSANHNLNQNLSVPPPRTPLHYAAANCNYHCVFALVGSGASVRELDKRGCSPLHYAAAGDAAGKSVLCVCVCVCVCAEFLQWNLLVTEKCLNSLFSLQCMSYPQCSFSNSILCVCVRCLEYLLRNDADPAVRDHHGFSPVHYASAYGHTLCLELVRAAPPTHCLPKLPVSRCNYSNQAHYQSQ